MTRSKLKHFQTEYVRWQTAKESVKYSKKKQQNCKNEANYEQNPMLTEYAAASPKQTVLLTSANLTLKKPEGLQQVNKTSTSTWRFDGGEKKA